MRVYHSNRLELLAENLAGLIESNPPEPFTPERIVVPHRTMEHWLRLELARELGIAANMKFELPAAFAWSILRGAVPSLSKSQGFSPDTLRWHLFELLPDFAQGADAAEVRRFLADGDERKRFELADKLAGVFDRCINFRDDWIRDWEQGAAPHWQARLWQLLAEKVPEQHWVNALDAFKWKRAGEFEPCGWPRRAFVFGISALSPSYLQLLRQLAGSIELHVFLFNPSSGFWSDLRTKREINRLTEDGNAQDQHFEEGNKLLAAWAQAGRDTFDTLIANEVEERPVFPQAGSETRLNAVQGDIQEVRDAAEAAGPDAVPPDNSLQIHCCHSAMREAEVLHDRLLELLDGNPDIEPADIMILTPNLARYGSMIAAVFEAEGCIPVALSRFRAADSPTARAFFDLLSLPGTRYGVESVLAPLDAPSLRARFGIRENSLPAIRDWVRQAGIRRGVDTNAGDHAPAMPGNTWREGLNRLLMGYAAGDTDDLALGVAPCSIRGEGGFEAGEEDYETLGKFVSYCIAAFELRQKAARSRTAGQWTETLRAILEKFFDNGSSRGAYPGFEEMREAADEFESIGNLIENCSGQAGRIDCPISFEVIRLALKEAAASPALGPARLADGATIGRLASGQVLPAKIVCAVGMNDDGFPGNPPRHTFDLVEQDKRRPGDRDVRHEDRFAFLEALLAARSAFIVTYTGRDQRDDSEIPPSVLVDELHDYLAVRFPAVSTAGRSGEDEEAPLNSLRIEHPLQPFSARYFSGENGLFSYSRTMLDAAKTMCRPASNASHRFAGRLPEPEASRRKTSLAELERFFTDPAQGFLKERFRIRLSKEEQAVDETEPLQLDGLQRWGLRDEIQNRTNEARQERVAPEAVKSLLLARGHLPYGSFGELAYDEAFAVVDTLREELTAFAGTLAAEPLNLELEVGEFRLSGVVPHVDSERMVWWRNGRLRVRDRIAVCIRQLALMQDGRDPPPAILIYLDGRQTKFVKMEPPNPETESIGNWLESWWSGLTAPLRFFPESSWAYASELAKGETGGAFFKARQKWRGDSFGSTFPECDEPCNRLVWSLDGDEDPISDEFADLSESLLLPVARRTL